MERVDQKAISGKIRLRVGMKSIAPPHPAPRLCRVGTEDLEAVIIDLETTLGAIASATRDDAWIRGRASLAKGVLHHVVPRLLAILTRHRATPTTEAKA